MLLYRLDLEQRNPELVKLLELLENSLNNDTMVTLNSRVQIDGASEGWAAANPQPTLNLGIDLEAVDGDGPWQRRLEGFWREIPTNICIW